ncbi:MAG: two pore domain potassium channel family protein, partial [Methanobacterium sp.]
MKRHYQVIFEAILSVLIIIDILVMGLMIAGLTEGIMLGTVYSIGTYDLIIALLILIDFIFYRIRKDKLNKNNWEFIRENWAYIVSIIPIIFICFNIFHLFGYIYIIGLIVILRFYALYKVLRITGKEVKKYPSKTKLDYATFVL